MSWLWHQFRREQRSFVLIFVAFLVASLGLITYLNLKDNFSARDVYKSLVNVDPDLAERLKKYLR